MKIITFIVILLAFPIIAHSEVVYKKHINDKIFNASLDDKQLTLSYNSVLTSFDISGFTVNDLFIVPDGKRFWVIFIDMAGQSAGGEVRTILFNGKFTEIDNDKSANRINTKRIKNENYIFLWQHDSDDLKYVSDIFLVKNGLVKSYSKKIWHEVINDYENKISIEKISWKKSRYYSYISMCYKTVGDVTLANKYLLKAKDIDNNNPYTN